MNRIKDGDGVEVRRRREENIAGIKQEPRKEVENHSSQITRARAMTIIQDGQNWIYQMIRYNTEIHL